MGRSRRRRLATIRRCRSWLSRNRVTRSAILTSGKALHTSRGPYTGCSNLLSPHSRVIVVQRAAWCSPLKRAASCRERYLRSVSEEGAVPFKWRVIICLGPEARSRPREDLGRRSRSEDQDLETISCSRIVLEIGSGVITIVNGSAKICMKVPRSAKRYSWA